MGIRDFLKSYWFGRGVITLWLISSVLVFFLLTKIDGIVHETLYGYGLQFDYAWAQPYWLLLRFAFVGLAFPMVFGAIVLVSSFLGTDDNETRLVDRISDRGPTHAQMNAQSRVQTSVQTNARAVLISCSSCRRVFSTPLVLLDFSRGKEKLVNVCPYCNAVLRSARQKEKSVDVIVDLPRKTVDEEKVDH